METAVFWKQRYFENSGKQRYFGTAVFWYKQRYFGTIYNDGVKTKYHISTTKQHKKCFL